MLALLRRHGANCTLVGVLFAALALFATRGAETWERIVAMIVAAVAMFGVAFVILACVRPVRGPAGAPVSRATGLLDAVAEHRGYALFCAVLGVVLGGALIGPFDAVVLLPSLLVAALTTTVAFETLARGRQDRGEFVGRDQEHQPTDDRPDELGRS